jgi:AraC-like DNA-binding protein
MIKKNQKIAQYHLHKSHPEKLQFVIHDLQEYRKKSDPKAAIAHSHSYYQVIWFFEEGGTHTVDFKTYDIKKNMIFFISKDQIHVFDENLNVKGWLIHFNESFFMHTDIDIFLKYNIFSTQKNPCYVIDTDTVDTAGQYIELIRNELSRKQSFGYEDIIRFSLKSVLIILERAQQNNNQKQLVFTSHHELLFANYKNLIEENYQNGHAVQEYASLLNISSKTLNTITKKIANKAASQLISERVILEAKRLLRFTTLQIGEVAYTIGFNDPSYFIKYFKRCVGTSPKVYRESTN